METRKLYNEYRAAQLDETVLGYRKRADALEENAKWLKEIPDLGHDILFVYEENITFVHSSWDKVQETLHNVVQNGLLYKIKGYSITGWNSDTLCIKYTITDSKNEKAHAVFEFYVTFEENDATGLENLLKVVSNGKCTIEVGTVEARPATTYKQVQCNL